MSTYQVDTEDGTYEVEVDDGPSNESSASPGWSRDGRSYLCHNNLGCCRTARGCLGGSRPY